jgi:hypothetical protein
VAQIVVLLQVIGLGRLVFFRRVSQLLSTRACFGGHRCVSLVAPLVIAIPWVHTVLAGPRHALKVSPSSAAINGSHSISLNGRGEPTRLGVVQAADVAAEWAL